MIVDCECACHNNKGEVSMATQKKVAKKKVVIKKKVAKKVMKPVEKREAYLAGKIKILVSDPGKRPRTLSYKFFQLYKKHKTVGAVLKAGGRQSYLNWDMEKKYISFKPYKSY